METGMSRVQQIQTLLENDPDDVFLNFSLAMEWVSAGEHEAAIRQFDRVVELDRNYATAYFRKADVLAGLTRRDEARQTLQIGIEAAERAGDGHLKMKMTERLGQLD
jgi:tetratricopeptide (TPR) repeat protein